jgi:hypothetical protein
MPGPANRDRARAAPATVEANSPTGMARPGKDKVRGTDLIEPFSSR